MKLLLLLAITLVCCVCCSEYDGRALTSSKHSSNHSESQSSPDEFIR